MVYIRTDVLVNGFRQELDARLNDIKSSRVELERLYALRVDDGQIDEPSQSGYKEDSMKALRSADAAFNSFAGSIRSIKNVTVAWNQFWFPNCSPTQFSS